MNGFRPDGGQPSYPLLTTKEWGLLDTPYNKWTSSPNNKKDYSCMDGVHALIAGEEIPELKEAPSIGFLGRLRPLKAKLHLGMAPISRDRWLERKMDDPANYRNLLELMMDIILIFKCFNHEEVQKRTRNAFNFIVERHVEFEQAANLQRERYGIKEKLDLAGMWAEYWNDILSNMSNRTLQWLVHRVDEVQARAFAEYQDALKAAGNDETAIGEAGRKYYECVQDLRGALTRADYTLAIPMTGFKGYTSSSAFTDLPLEQRRDIWIKVLGTKPFKHQGAILDAQDKADEEEARNPPSIEERANIMAMLKRPAHPRFRDTENLLGHYLEGKVNRDETRLALRGPPKPPTEEYWITGLRERMEFYATNSGVDETHPGAWGFVCYRLTCDQTEKQWTSFMEKFENDYQRSGQWIEGFDSIKDTGKLTVIDGRDLGIAEGDIAAAKRHFSENYSRLPEVGRMWTQDFLVIDKQSFASYDTPSKEEIRPPPPYGPGFGCNGGHVRLVDMTYEYMSQERINAESPGYTGEMKVLTALLLEEIYPLLATLSVRPSGMWPCARLHARQVYVGTTDAAQEGWWEFNRIDFAVQQGLFDRLRRKKAKLLAKMA